jgi:transaldolase
MASSVSANVNERLAALTAAGTSPWLDQIRRSMIEGGELQRLVDEWSLRGETSNPSIFEKAIIDSGDYDDEVKAMAEEGLHAWDIYERIAIRDVQLALDVMKPTWEAADHDDGFVSLEVAPNLARKGDETLEQARDYWKRVDRPNLMVKIPGTEECLPAIEEALYHGVNINITLLFSVESYDAVCERYIRALERRLEEGKSLDVHSVASFFVSRVDTEADKRLEELGHEELKGTAAVANAREAYQHFQKTFSGERWEKLADAGAFVQRPLWASTGTKNDDYSDIKYVEELVCEHTVNTMPMATLEACADHLEVTGQTGAQDPTEDLKRLADAGLDMGDVTKTLLIAGIEAFEKSMDGLIAGLDEKAKEIKD